MYQEVFALEEEVFKVLANHKRLEIIQLLQKGELNVSEMVFMLGIRQPNLSQHLTLLRQHKLVTTTKQGQKIYYKLASQDIAEAVELIYRFLASQHGLAAVPVHKISAKLYPVVQDPVCRMRISAASSFGQVAFGDSVYYFCASGCHDRFVSSPEKYTTTINKEVKV